MREWSPYAGNLSDSETLAITARARQMRAEGIEVTPFAAGEPDFDTPAFVCEAAAQAIREGCTRYGPAAGTPALRAAVAEHLEGRGFEGILPEQTIVSAGAKGVLHLALTVLLRPGDEVLVPTPCWLSYEVLVRAAGGVPRFVETQAADRFVIDPERLEAAIGPRTRCIVLNSPGNPTGAIQPDAVQRRIGELAERHDLAVVSDEIYEHLVYEPARFTSFAALAPQARDRTLIVGGVSKAWAMTGWRIGWGGGAADWVRRMIRLQSHVLSGPPEIGQRAALAALHGPRDVVDAMRARFLERRNVMHEALGRVPGVRVQKPDGAFYMLPDVSAWLGRRFAGREITDVAALGELLIEHARAAVVPGHVFQAPSAIRLSYACSRTDIAAGLDRIAAFARDLS